MATLETVTGAVLEDKVVRAPGPVALDFYQESCAPCRVLEPRLEHVAQEYGDRIPIYRVDLERDMAVAERFGVMSIPTVLIFRDGREVDRLDGLITERDLREAFERAEKTR